MSDSIITEKSTTSKSHAQWKRSRSAPLVQSRKPRISWKKGLSKTKIKVNSINWLKIPKSFKKQKVKTPKVLSWWILTSFVSFLWERCFSSTRSIRNWPRLWSPRWRTRAGLEWLKSRNTETGSISTLLRARSLRNRVSSYQIWSMAGFTYLTRR